MWVCLCNRVNSQTVAEAVAAGASTTNDVAQACGAGADCGRCRRTVRAILQSSAPEQRAHSDGADQRRTPPSGDRDPTSWPSR